MGRAGRRQSGESDPRLGHGELDVSPEAAFRLGAIEEDVADLRVGDKEAAEGTVAVRHRFKADLGTMSVADFVSKLSGLVATHNVNEEPS